MIVGTLFFKLFNFINKLISRIIQEKTLLKSTRTLKLILFIELETD